MQKIKTEVYSRVSGYFRPVKQWNAGKREEFTERKFAYIGPQMLRKQSDERSETL